MIPTLPIVFGSYSSGNGGILGSQIPTSLETWMHAFVLLGTVFRVGMGQSPFNPLNAELNPNLPFAGIIRSSPFSPR